MSLGRVGPRHDPKHSVKIPDINVNRFDPCKDRIVLIAGPGFLWSNITVLLKGWQDCEELRSMLAFWKSCMFLFLVQMVITLLDALCCVTSGRSLNLSEP